MAKKLSTGKSIDKIQNLTMHKYRGIDVWYHEGIEQWVCEIGGRQSHTDRGLKMTRKRIDAFLINERNFERFDAILVYGASDMDVDGLSTCVVTSETDEGYYRVKIPHSRGVTMVSKDSVVRDTDENREILKIARKYEQQANALEEKAKNLRKTITGKKRN